jgi:hypothetical protein
VKFLVRHLVAIALLALFALPAPAFASADQVLNDCVYDGRIDHKYSNAELRRALDRLPSDEAEYSDCADLIAAAITSGSDKSGGAASPGVGATDPAAEAAAKASDQSDLAAIASDREKAPQLEVGGHQLKPDDSGFFNLNNAANRVPAPLLIALLLLCAMAMVAGLGSARERVPALARIPFLSKIPTLRVPFIGRRG